jgi:ectoine hydroxylase-related dioxygenase (phytanoyl-CoA dioxygenase family)
MATDASNRIDAHAPDVAAQATALIERDGYVIVNNVLDAAQCDALVAEVERVEHEYGITEGTNDFEGFCTRRIFNLIGKSELFRNLVTNERTLSLVEAVLDPWLLLSGTTSMNIGPGETRQLLHADDGMVSLPRPHPATMVTTLWALTDFTADNGGTCFVPGSHRFPTMPRPADVIDGVVSAAMPRGSVLVFHASLWHGSGANVTSVRRYGLSIQYVAGWCRQQQNLMLGMDPAIVATFPTRLQELIGYSLYRNVMGHVDRKHPATLLGVEREPDMVWDKMTPRHSSE